MQVACMCVHGTLHYFRRAFAFQALCVPGYLHAVAHQQLLSCSSSICVRITLTCVSQYHNRQVAFCSGVMTQIVCVLNVNSVCFNNVGVVV